MPPKGKKSTKPPPPTTTTPATTTAQTPSQAPPAKSPVKKTEQEKKQQEPKKTKEDLDFEKDLEEATEIKDDPKETKSVDNEQNKKQVSAEGDAEDQDPDGRSVWVKNVDYSAKAEQLAEHFNQCGQINRVTIACDKFNNNYPLGYAYIQFVDKDGQQRATRLHESLFKGRQLTVMQKRRNVPGRGRYKGGRGFPFNAAAMFGMRPFGMMPGMRRPRGHYYRGY